MIQQVLSLAPSQVDLGGLPAAAREREADRLTREEAERPFDLARGPLARTLLLLLDGSGGEESRLLLTFHHIVVDGWSVGVLIRELAAIYPAFLAGSPSPLPEVPVQYADFALWQRRWLRGDVPVPQAALQALYWLTHWGLEDAECSLDWRFKLMRVRVECLEEALGYRPKVNIDAANDPVFQLHPPLHLVAGAALQPSAA